MAAVKTYILFPIETAVRELQGKLLLAHALAQNGFLCLIGSKTNIKRVVGKVYPFVYFDKGFHEGVSEQVYKTIHSYGGLVVSLDEENGIDYEDYFNILKRFPEDCFKRLDFIFLWGRKQAAVLESNRASFNEKKVRISGHPKYDLLKPKYDLLFERFDAQIDKAYGSDFIFIPTSIKYYNNINPRAHVIGNYANRAKALHERFEYEKDKIEQLFRLIEGLAKKTQYKIIVRPHPEEEKNTYERRFKDFPQVKVVYEFPIIYWLRKARLIIHNDTSCAVEAFMLGKNPISILPYLNRNLSPWMPLQVSSCYQDENKLLADIVSGNLTSSATVEKDLLENYFSFNSCSYKTIADEIARLIGEQNKGLEPARGLNIVEKANLKFRATLSKLKGRLSKSRNDLATNKLQGLDFQTLNQWSKELNTINKTSINLDQICDKLFLVSKTN